MKRDFTYTIIRKYIKETVYQFVRNVINPRNDSFQKLITHRKGIEIGRYI